jgi:hypothetical protein
VPTELAEHLVFLALSEPMKPPALAVGRSHHHSGWTIPGNQRGYVPRPARVRAVGRAATHTESRLWGAVLVGGWSARGFSLICLSISTIFLYYRYLRISGEIELTGE